MHKFTDGESAKRSVVGGRLAVARPCGGVIESNWGGFSQKKQGKAN